MSDCVVALDLALDLTPQARHRTRHSRNAFRGGLQHRVGLVVDELLGQQQVVVKNLEANYRRVDDVSGATIMGDGRVALILDVGSLVRRSRH